MSTHTPEPDHDAATRRASDRRLTLIVAGVLLLLGALGAVALWLTDRLTREGELTVYTVRCEDGAWEGQRCAGRLVPAERFRYRALKNRREVLFWVLGESSPSRKLTACEIKDGRNWSCPVSPDAEHSITLHVHRGQPAHETGTAREFHAVSKFSWLAMKAGFPMGKTAS